MNYFSKDSNWQKFKKILLSWIGTPYRHFARVKGRGADCTMFVGAAWKELGVLTDVEFYYYPPDWYQHSADNRIIEGITKHFEEFAISGIGMSRHKPSEEMIRGDLIVFSTNKKGVLNHAGIYMGHKGMIHASNSRGVTLFELDDVWRKRIKVFFRVECI